MQELTRHLEEAIELNTSRMPRYAQLTDGQSLPYSKRLIRYERWFAYGSWLFDRVGDRYQSKGVPFLKAEFVEMSNVLDFAPHYPKGIDHTCPLQKINIQPFSQHLAASISARNFKDIVTTCDEFLEQLEQQVHVYCLLRHSIESLRRIAFLVPIHRAQCEQLQLTPPTNYSVFLLKVHRWILQQSKDFDEAIAPIQIKGVPFIFQDLPLIDLEVV